MKIDCVICGTSYECLLALTAHMQTEHPKVLRTARKNIISQQFHILAEGVAQTSLPLWDWLIVLRMLTFSIEESLKRGYDEDRVASKVSQMLEMELDGPIPVDKND